MPWYSAFPDPKHTELQGISPDDLAALLRDPATQVAKEVLVVDVRRTDFEVGGLLKSFATWGAAYVVERRPLALSLQKAPLACSNGRVNFTAP